jgi:phage terminase large subunit GpA-like protein
MKRPEQSEDGPHPGFIHLPTTVDQDWCEQLVAEKAILRRYKGISYREYHKTGRNEALDCAVYAMAAKAILNPNYNALSILIQTTAAKAKVKESEPETPKEPPPRTPRPRSKPKSRKGFVRGW